MKKAVKGSEDSEYSEYSEFSDDCYLARKPRE